ncbi:MAG: dual specificity protein phosphatase [Myxococcota bacterium]|jgi:hypothetical protein|nr:dual specificity protein phosphatase [Myxococcota bacterium]
MNDINTLTLIPDSPASLEPAEWWRWPCPVTPRIYLCGDLSHEPAAFAAQLDEWVALGVTTIVDVRAEWSDEHQVLERHPHLEYVWLGTHDSGGSQSMGWFDDGVAAIRNALADPDAKVLVHCHMGVNRAPSLVYAALLAEGFGIEEGLEAIRDARPIAGILYADSAVRWFGRQEDWSATEVGDAEHRTRVWLRLHPADVGWIISRIRQAERAV